MELVLSIFSVIVLIVVLTAVLPYMSALSKRLDNVEALLEKEDEDAPVATVKPGVLHMTPEREYAFAKTRKENEGDY